MYNRICQKLYFLQMCNKIKTIIEEIYCKYYIRLITTEKPNKKESYISVTRKKKQIKSTKIHRKQN